MRQVHSLQTPLRVRLSPEHSHYLVSRVGFNPQRIVRWLLVLTALVYNKLGYHWATSLLAFLTLIMAPFP